MLSRFHYMAVWVQWSIMHIIIKYFFFFRKCLPPNYWYINNNILFIISTNSFSFNIYTIKHLPPTSRTVINFISYCASGWHILIRAAASLVIARHLPCTRTMTFPKNDDTTWTSSPVSNGQSPNNALSAQFHAIVEQNPSAAFDNDIIITTLSSNKYVSIICWYMLSISPLIWIILPYSLCKSMLIIVQ